jgi:hypothetical protein
VVNGGVGGGCAIVVVAKELTDNMEIVSLLRIKDERLRIY